LLCDHHPPEPLPPWPPLDPQLVTGVGDIGPVIPDIGGDGPASADGLAGPQLCRGGIIA
jgi:hypothetical protein